MSALGDSRVTACATLAFLVAVTACEAERTSPAMNPNKGDLLMEGRKPVEYRNLTEQELRDLPPVHDYAANFTREEVLSALKILGMEKDSAAVIRMIFEPEGPPPVSLFGDLANGLSLVSEETGAKVRKMLNESPEQANNRIREFKKTLADDNNL